MRISQFKDLRFAIIARILMSPFYAVRKGRNCGVFPTWEECKMQVNGYSGAEYKKFSTEQEAREFTNSVSQNDRVQFNSFAPWIPEQKRLTTPAEQQTSTNNMRWSSSNERKSFAVCYTDGACVNNGKLGARAGIGVYWGENDPRNVSEPLKGLQTNNRAEIEACSRAIEQAKRDGITHLEIRTDSKYVLKCVTEWMPKWRKNNWVKPDGEMVKNLDDLLHLDRLANSINVKWTYVVAHSGTEGNEKADMLAKSGLQK
ncbi:Ribonuclease H1 [Trichinella pseudospiralis]|uniref:Ribonuclease H1 n=1 Tax=Trichinella pseudospiralis TaxID=6337 RepID=A0A0V0XJP5_TRIPS|nr:Ribonuclease H1 [Trichinella pseudospiralis]